MTTLGAAEGPTVTMGWDKYRDGPRARDARGGRTGGGEARVGRRRTLEIVAWVVSARGDAGAGARGAKVACWVRRVTNTEREHEGAKKAARGVASAPPRRRVSCRAGRIRTCECARQTLARTLLGTDAAGRPRTDEAEINHPRGKVNSTAKSARRAERRAPLGGAEAKPRAGRADRHGGRKSEGRHRLESRRVSYSRALSAST